MTDDLTDSLVERFRDIDTDITIVAVSENAELDKLFVSLDILTEHLPHIDLIAIGLIDLRTCDCFPYLREKLETYADLNYLAPFDVPEIVREIHEMS